MKEENVITPFEIGVCSALMLLGKAAALNPHVNIDELKRDAEALMNALPNEPTWTGGKRIHQAAIESVLDGISKVQR
ncbi:hypothetical protein [Pseudomonas amygdali]|uniref:hypothetical protein n=1 Tax=Pseudomonas amygdali TaxID=47877 RepID=UPI0006B9E7CB|nr:hypothetical protein [Pseudomonas amygdali]PPS33954.1 hypothetical protein BVY10_04725 [Pseudomonas amygdali pv. morsprunorum]RMV89659.1 hypothetical protein ALP04_01941 [Pseudomonas amygdali pv. sesami]